MNIIPWIRHLALDDMETRAMGLAFDLACESVGGVDATAREIIAMGIVEAAKAGERNPSRLCEGALKNLGIGRVPREEAA
jgi:hypothetical protein